MPILIEHITQIALTFLLLLILGNGVIIGAAITRRQRREKYFLRLDEIRKQYHPVIIGLLTQQIPYADGLAKLNTLSGADRLMMLERLITEQKPTTTQIPLLCKLSEDLGLVMAWQARLTRRIEPSVPRDGLARSEGVIVRLARLDYLARAESAEYLGFIRHHPSWPLLVKALDDPHPDVQPVAARALAAIKEPQSFRPLAERMSQVVLDPNAILSLRSIKSALVSFPLPCASQLLSSLHHANRRVRFLATDIIREMVERESKGSNDFLLDRKVFDSELAETFLTELPFDDNPDVRARSAPVTAYIADGRSAAVLLTLVQDGEWFVRLHAVRALAKRKFLPQAERVAQLLSDSHWMVREAAARALIVYGKGGMDHLIERFLATDDRYSREQIAEEMQRAGLIPALLKQFAADDSGPAMKVTDQLIQMQKTSYMVSYLSTDAERGLKKKFIEEFGQRPDAQIRVWVRTISLQESDPTLQSLAVATLGGESAKEEI